MTQNHVLISLVSLPVLLAAQDLSPKEIAQKSLPAVVTVRTFGKDGSPSGTGSGFVVRADGIVVTNFHVIDKAYFAKVERSNGDLHEVAGVIEFDRVRDFAVLKARGVDLPVVAMANSDRLEVGDEVVAIGAPKGFTSSVSNGIVSQWRDWQGGYKVIQHTAPISPGSSGGPLFNRRGQVVALNTFLWKEGNSLFFSVPVNYVRAALDSSDGKWLPLDQFSTAIAKQDKAREEAEFQEYINKNFTAHRDAAGLFVALVPKDWRSERTEFTNDESGGTRHVITIFRAPGAERAEITGWLSAGIRVHLRFPAKAQTWGGDGAAWAGRQFDAMIRGYRTAKPGARGQAKLGELPAVEQVIQGESEQISKPEIMMLTVATSPQCLVTVEVVAPAESAKVLQSINDVFRATLKPAWNGSR